MEDLLQDMRAAFEVSPDQFKAIVEGFLGDYAHGLNTASAAGLATMIPSFVTRLPNGTETGTFLALDLGGSTLRVSAVQLLGQGETKVLEEERRTISMTDPLRHASADAFIDWIADAVAVLLQKVGLTDPVTPMAMGVCWSFPIDQTSLTEGRVLRMGKGFEIVGMEGQDLRTLLEQGLQRKQVSVKVVALLNDTVGTLVAHCYTNPKTRVGFIYGTGVNAAYPEKVTHMVKLGHLPEKAKGGHMLVNTEIDIFGSDAYLPLNRFDRALDTVHNQPNFQLYEKMMSGAYLGELVRLAASELVLSGDLFQGHMPAQFQCMYDFATSSMGAIESIQLSPSQTEQYQDKACLDPWLTFEDYSPTRDDIAILAEVCAAVSKRAAVLAGAAMASLIEQQRDTLVSGTTDDTIVIGVNGSTFELYPAMAERIQSALAQWFEPEVVARIRLEVAKEGGCIGGALIAMLSTQETCLQTSCHADSNKLVTATTRTSSESHDDKMAVLQAVPDAKNVKDGSQRLPRADRFLACFPPLLTWVHKLKAKRFFQKPESQHEKTL